MVNKSAASLLAEYLDQDNDDIDRLLGTGNSDRLINPHREQKSAARFATQARYSRHRRASADLPRGPRRRQRQPCGL